MQPLLTHHLADDRRRALADDAAAHRLARRTPTPAAKPATPAPTSTRICNENVPFLTRLRCRFVGAC